MHRAFSRRGLGVLAILAGLFLTALPAHAESQRVIDDNTWIRGKLRAQQWIDLDGWDLTTGIPDLPTQDRIRWYYDDSSMPGHLYMSRGGESWQEIVPGNGSGISGGTANSLTKYTGSTSIAPSLITDDGTNVGLPAATGIGTAAPNAKAALEIASTTKGFLGPRVTTIQRDAMTSPPEGLQVYNTTTHEIEVYNGTLWVAAAASGVSGSGTPNQIAKWTGSAAVGASSITDDGSTVSITGDLAASGVLKLNGAAVSDVSGQLLSSALPTVPLAKGGTNATDAATARTNLGVAIGSDVPSPTGTGASGTWGISVSGNAANVSGTVAAGHGGTGITTPTTSAFMVGNGSGWDLATFGTGLAYDAGTHTLTSTGSGGVTGTGSANVFPLWSGSTALSTSPLTNPVSSAIELAEAASPGVGNSGKARIFADSTDHRLKMSLDGGAIVPIGTQTVFDVKAYGAKADAGTLNFTMNAGGFSACADGTLSCSDFTTAAYSGAVFQIPNAIETMMTSADTGSTLSGGITSGATTLTLNAPTSGTDWQHVLPGASITSLKIGSEMIGCTTFTGNVASGCTRGAEGTTAASHLDTDPVAVYAFTLKDAGTYTAVRSYAFPWHSFYDVGRKIVLPSAGWTYASPGTISDFDGAGYASSNESAWYPRVTPAATAFGDGYTGSIFSALQGTVSTVDGSFLPTLTSTNGTMSSNLSSQTETAIVGHDDTAAFQAALDAASAAGGGTVVFPAEGHYLLLGPITWPSHVHVVQTGATIYTPGTPTGAWTDINSGASGQPTLITAQGSLSLDEPQVSTFAHDSTSGIVAPARLATGGSLTTGVTYYYKVSASLSTAAYDPSHETALSRTMAFATPTAGNNSIALALLKSPFPAAKKEHIWRSDGLDTQGHFQWKLWRTIDLPYTTHEWTGHGYTNDYSTVIVDLYDDGSVTPTTATPPSSNSYYAPVTDLSWTGGTFIGTRNMQSIFTVDEAQDVHFDGVTFQAIGDTPLKLFRTENATVDHLVTEDTGHGVLVESGQHITLAHNHFLRAGFQPAQAYHSQSVSSPSGAKAAVSTGNPESRDVTWQDNEIEGHCADAGAHCQGMIVYGGTNVTLDHNYIHDAHFDDNDTTGLKAALWSPTLNHGITQAVRFRDSNGSLTDSRIENAGSGLLVDTLLDFQDWVMNAGNDTPYDDRPQIGGNVTASENTFSGSDTYALEVTNSSLSPPIASVSPRSDTGSFSGCPVDYTGSLLQNQVAFTTGALAYPQIANVWFVNNRVLASGYRNLHTATDAVLIRGSHCHLEGNLVDGVANGAMTSTPLVLGSTTYQPNDNYYVRNTIKNTGKGSFGNNSSGQGVFAFGQRLHITDNTFINGTGTSPTAIHLGMNVVTAPYTGLDYSAYMTGNTFSGYATTIKTEASTGRTSLALDAGGQGRPSGTQGTALAASDFTLTGFGTGASASTVTGTDTAGSVTVTAGTSPSANPTVKLTFHDGAWPGAPIVTASPAGGTGTPALVTVASTTTTLTLTYVGTPVSGSTYTLNWTARQ